MLPLRGLAMVNYPITKEEFSTKKSPMYYVKTSYTIEWDSELLRIIDGRILEPKTMNITGWWYRDNSQEIQSNVYWFEKKEDADSFLAWMSNHPFQNDTGEV
jgi:hypothetical protein